MEIRQMQHFLSVARHGSLSAAASSLGITQSAVSTSLAALERDVGATLVDRAAGRRTVELTPAGIALLGPAKALLDQVAAARVAVAAVSGVAVGIVRVATTLVPEKYGVLQTVLDLQQDHPELNVSLTTAGSGDVIAMVRDGGVDFGLAAIDALDEADLEIDAVLDSPLGMFCRSDHRLAKRQVIDVEDLTSERLIGFPTSQKPRQLFDAWWVRSTAPAEPMTSLESGDPAVVLDLVRAGKGVSYAPLAFAQASLSQGLVLIPLKDAPLWRLALITRRGGPTTPAAVKLYHEHLLRCRAR